jgi:hypothetical protein
LVVAVALVLTGCDDSNTVETTPTSQKIKGESSTSKTVFFKFKGTVSPSEVASLIGSQSNVELKNISFYGGGISGNFNLFERYSAESASEKMQAFDKWIRTHVDRRRQYEKKRLQKDLGGVGLRKFAASADLQALGKTLVRRHQEREELLARVSSDGSLIHAVTAKGKVSELREILSRSFVASAVVPSQIDESVSDLTIPLPKSIRVKEKKRAARNKKAFRKIKAVQVPAGKAVPQQISRLYDQVKTAAREEYGVSL